MIFRMRIRACVVTLLLLSLGGRLYAQQEAVSPTTTRLTSTLGLARLVDLTAQLNGVEIEYEPGSLRGKSVTLRLTHDVTPAELWDLCLTVLHSNSMTLIERHGQQNLYAAVTIADAAKATLPQPMLDLGSRAPGYQSVIRHLTALTPEAVVEAMKPVVDLDAKLSIKPAPALSGVVVSGTRERVEYALSIIDRIEGAGTLPSVHVIPLRHRSAIEVVAEVKAIAATLGKQGGFRMKSDISVGSDQQTVRVIGPGGEFETIQSMIEQADRPSAILTRSFDPRGYPLDTVSSFLETMAHDPSPRGSGEQWRVVGDELTNTLIVTGTESELQAAAAALEQLSAMPAEGRRIIRIIGIKNREATKIREIASQLLNARLLGDQGDGLTRGAADPQAPSAAPPPEPAAAPVIQQDLELAVDSEMNTIIATGSPRRIEQLESIIQQLDVRQPQVQLEVVMLSLSESETRDFGVELAGIIDTGDTLIGLGSLFGLSSISPSSGSAQASGTGGTAVILSPGDFSAVIRAIQTVNDGRSVSMPSIVVNNNETATLNSTTTQPYLTTTITDSNIVTSRGGSASAGTTINVSPQIAAGDHIVLDYSFTLSSFVGEASAAGVEPPTQQTSLNSIATIPDGYTIALGGIESTSEGDSDTKTPLLGDIPILGALFKSQSDSSSRSRFYVFIRATVMRSPGFEHLKYISEDLAQEVGVDDGWPEVEPRIIR